MQSIIDRTQKFQTPDPSYVVVSHETGRQAIMEKGKTCLGNLFKIWQGQNCPLFKKSFTEDVNQL